MSQNSALSVSRISSDRRVLYLLTAFFLFILVNEYLAVYNPFYIAIANAVVIFLALSIAAFNASNILYRLLPALAIVPFMRLLGLVLPLTISVGQIWYLLISLPVLVAMFFVLRTRGISLAEIGLRRSPWATQLLITLSGLPLGFIGYLILHPRPLFSWDGALMWIINLLTLLICVALTEEALFRGILLRFLSQVNSKYSSLWLAILYASLHWGSGSLTYVVYMGVIGLLFARFVRHTHSIVGTTLANFLFVVGMEIIWPVVMR